MLKNYVDNFTYYSKYFKQAEIPTRVSHSYVSNGRLSHYLSPTSHRRSGLPSVSTCCWEETRHTRTGLAKTPIVPPEDREWYPIKQSDKVKHIHMIYRNGLWRLNYKMRQYKKIEIYSYILIASEAKQGRRSFLTKRKRSSFCIYVYIYEKRAETQHDFMARSDHDFIWRLISRTVL